MKQLQMSGSSGWLFRILTGILAICWMFLIGSFSAQTGTESGSMSKGVAEHLVTLEEQVFHKEYTAVDRENKIEALQFPIRKLAHMTEYGLLVMILALHFGCYSFGAGNLQLRLLVSWLFAIGYAATDEIHQLFVPGRSGQLTDVCIDAAGALLGVLGFSGFFWICRYFSRKE